MSREQERIRRKLEDNPVMECNKIRNRYCPALFRDFADTKDPRNQSYTVVRQIKRSHPQHIKSVVIHGDCR